jgi:hypothetical protein
MRRPTAYAFCGSPPLWAMGVAHALKTIAHRVGSYEDKIATA